MADLVFPVFMEHLNLTHNKLVEEFEESIGYGKGLDDVREIWQAVKDARCRKLLVEKDYANTDYDVDEILEMVLENKGEIHIMEEGILHAHDGMAAILRY
ncbi:MAG: hypothetical protein IPN29_13500 [Saprospiraceae bacterium]|nr:hypothetical protein [Saprospiraceae bacterium]